MIVKIVLPICVAIGILLGVAAVIVSSQTPPTPDVPFTPPTPPFEHFIASIGIVESSSEDLFIGVPFSEIIDRVYVESGDFVKQGEPLFTLNTLLLRAQLLEAEAGYEVAVAEYQKQLDLPRTETIPPAKSKMLAAEAGYLNRLAQFELVENIENPKAVSRDEYNQRKYAALEAKAQLQGAEDDFNLLMAGAWVRDLEIYRARKREAKGKVKLIQDKIERSTIRAPLSGVVLKINARVGEFAQAGELNTPLLIFGVVNPMNILVDIDEEEVWRVIKGAPGMAFVRGNSNLSSKLRYLRVIPYLVPKQALSGVGPELVDTRVLQVEYQLEDSDIPVYPGELMDIYIEARSNAEAR